MRELCDRVTEEATRKLVIPSRADGEGSRATDAVSLLCLDLETPTVRSLAPLGMTEGKTRRENLVRKNCLLLNFVGVLRELVVKDARKIDVVQNDHVGVVFLVIVVLPRLIPPAKTCDRRPVI
jgi:hypothetical protein